MIELGVAFTWIAISAASAKGLTVLARVAAAPDTEAELALPVAEVGFRHDGYRSELLGRPLSSRP